MQFGYTQGHLIMTESVSTGRGTLYTPSSGSVAYVCHMSQSISFLIYLCKEEKHYAHMSRSTNQSTNVVIVCPAAPDTFHRLCN